MKTYKLKQWYPTLPKDWKVGMEVGQGDRSTTDGHFSPCSSEYTDFAVMVDVVKNNPEFWELTKEYEILIASHKINGDDFKNGIFDCRNYLSWNLNDINNEWNIKSVKRLSDGQVFTINDFCAPIEAKFNAHKITTIEFGVTGALRIGSEGNYYVGIEDITHLFEPEYEIISISTHSLFGVSGSYIDIKVFKEGKQPTWTIHSVKRLSDGEIFTVGDTVINPKLRSNATFKITSFTLDCNKEHLLVLGSGAIGLRKIEKVKIPVFVTKDGVEIFHGDEFFVLFLDNVIKEPEHCVYGAYLAQNGSSHTWLTPFLNFSTREKADEFKNKILNEIKFSMLDILNAKTNKNSTNPELIEIDLKKLTK